MTLETKQHSESNLSLLSVDSAKEHYSLFNKFKKEICKNGIDYGLIPGTGKPTLFKAGAEKLLKAFNLYPSIEETSRTVDLKTGFVDFEYKVFVKNVVGFPVGEGIGSCNSFEDKYLFTGWRKAQKPTGKTEEYRLKKEKLGRNKKFGNNWEWQERETKQVHELIALKNTIQKMAKKRAFVDACLMSTGGGEFFNQDIEDMDISPDLDYVLTEFEQVLRYAINQTKTTGHLTALWKMCSSLHKEQGVINQFKEAKKELDENG